MHREHRLLVGALRLGGGFLLLAFPAALLPFEWMAATHDWLGLGELRPTPLTDYLTRSLSLMYGMRGVLLLVFSTDVRRYRTPIAVLAWMDVAFGLAMIAIDLHAGMPPSWTWGEGPGIVAFGLVFAYGVRSVPREPGDGQP